MGGAAQRDRRAQRGGPARVARGGRGIREPGRQPARRIRGGRARCRVWQGAATQAQAGRAGRAGGGASREPRGCRGRGCRGRGRGRGYPRQRRCRCGRCQSWRCGRCCGGRLVGTSRERAGGAEGDGSRDRGGRRGNNGGDGYWTAACGGCCGRADVRPRCGRGRCSPCRPRARARRRRVVVRARAAMHGGGSNRAASDRAGTSRRSSPAPRQAAGAPRRVRRAGAQDGLPRGRAAPRDAAQGARHARGRHRRERVRGDSLGAR